MGRSVSDHVALCKVRLVGVWIKRREVVNGVRWTRSENFREHQCMEGYGRCLESKVVEWDEGRNIEEIWEPVKRAMVDNVRDVCG